MNWLLIVHDFRACGKTLMQSGSGRARLQRSLKNDLQEVREGTTKSCR